MANRKVLTAAAGASAAALVLVGCGGPDSEGITAEHVQRYLVGAASVDPGHNPIGGDNAVRAANCEGEDGEFSCTFLSNSGSSSETHGDSLEDIEVQVEEGSEETEITISAVEGSYRDFLGRDQDLNESGSSLLDDAESPSVDTFETGALDFGHEGGEPEQLSAEGLEGVVEEMAEASEEERGFVPNYLDIDGVGCESGMDATVGSFVACDEQGEPSEEGDYQVGFIHYHPEEAPVWTSTGYSFDELQEAER